MKIFQSIFFSLLLFFVSCGQRGALIITPPPIPLKVEDLTVKQRGVKLIIKFKFPKKKLDGSDLRKVDELVITMNIMDKEKKSKKKRIRKTVKNIDLEKSRRKKFVFSAEVSKIYSVEVQYMCDGKKSRIAKKTFLTAKLPAPPKALEYGFDEEKIYIKIENSDRFSSYRIYVEENNIKKLKGEIKIDENEESKKEFYEYNDTSFEYGRDYKYYITGVLKISKDYETDFSKEILISTKDNIPPGKPEGVRYYIIDKKVHLLWKKSNEKDLKGYVVYIKKKDEKEYRKYNKEPIKENEVEIDAGNGVFSIYIKAVDFSGNESAPSEIINLSINPHKNKNKTKENQHKN